MVLPHPEGGFGVTFNDVSKDDVFHTTTSWFVVWLGDFYQECQDLWLPKDDLRDSSSWSSSPLLLLRDIHSKFLSDYRCKEVYVSSLSRVNLGTSGGISSQDGVSQQQEVSTLSIPQFRPLIEDSFVSDEISVSNVPVPVIPSHWA
jgi:hypothetical protein